MKKLITAIVIAILLLVAVSLSAQDAMMREIFKNWKANIEIQPPKKETEIKIVIQYGQDDWDTKRAVMISNHNTLVLTDYILQQYIQPYHQDIFGSDQLFNQCKFGYEPIKFNWNY